MRCTRRCVCSFWHAAAGGAAFPGQPHTVCVTGRVFSNTGMLARARAARPCARLRVAKRGHRAASLLRDPFSLRRHIWGCKTVFPMWLPFLGWQSLVPPSAELTLTGMCEGGEPLPRRPPRRRAPRGADEVRCFAGWWPQLSPADSLSLRSTLSARETRAKTPGANSQPCRASRKMRRPRPHFANARSLGCSLSPRGGRKGGLEGWLDGPGMLGAR